MSIFSCCFVKKKEIDNHVSMNNQMFPCKHIDFIEEYKEDTGLWVG